MPLKILKAFSLSVLSACLSFTFFISLVTGILFQDELLAILELFVISLKASLFLFPVLISLLLVSSWSENISEKNLIIRLKQWDFYCTLVCTGLGLVFFNKVMGASHLGFLISIPLAIIMLLGYFISSIFIWKKVFKEG